LRALSLQHTQEATDARSLHLDEVSKLRVELERVHSQLRRTEEGSQGWEEIIEAKDRELANLQAALGELTYESDAAERLRSEVSQGERGEAKGPGYLQSLHQACSLTSSLAVAGLFTLVQVRISRAEVQKLSLQVATLSQNNVELEAKVKAVEASLLNATQDAQRSRAVEIRTGEECLMLRRALDKVSYITQCSLAFSLTSL